MKRYLKECIHLCVVFCVLFGIGLSVFIYDSRPREVQYIESHGLEAYVEQDTEYINLVTDVYVLAVVRVTGQPVETKIKRENGTDYYTHVPVEVVEVIHGTRVQNGSKIYLRQNGNSEAVHRDALIMYNQNSPDRKLSRVEENGGYLKKGELLLVLIIPVHDVNVEYCGRAGKHTCCFLFEYATRTVNPDGSLGYRTNSLYVKYKNKLPFKLPYSQFNTLQEVRDAVPEWIEKNYRGALGRELTQDERAFLAKNNYADALNVLYKSDYDSRNKNILKHMERLAEKN